MLVISYNLRKHRAISELAALDARYSPDVLCLLECDTTDLAEEVGRLRLAHSTTGNRSPTPAMPRSTGSSKH